MTELQTTVERLRDRLAQLTSGQQVASCGRVIPCDLPELAEVLPGGGFPCGGLVEWFAPPGAGAGALVLGLVGRLVPGPVVVIDPSGEFYPPAAWAAGVEPKRLVLLRPRNQAEAQWAWEQVLRARGVGMVLGERPVLSTRWARRLQLAAATGGHLGMLLRPREALSEHRFSVLGVIVKPRASPGTSDDPRRVLELQVRSYRGRFVCREISVEFDDASGCVRVVSSMAASVPPGSTAATGGGGSRKRPASRSG